MYSWREHKYSLVKSVDCAWNTDKISAPAADPFMPAQVLMHPQCLDGAAGITPADEALRHDPPPRLASR